MFLKKLYLYINTKDTLDESTFLILSLITETLSLRESLSVARVLNLDVRSFTLEVRVVSFSIEN